MKPGSPSPLRRRPHGASLHWGKAMVDLLEGGGSASPTRGRQIDTRHTPDKPLFADTEKPRRHPGRRAIAEALLGNTWLPASSHDG